MAWAQTIGKAGSRSNSGSGTLPAGGRRSAGHNIERRRKAINMRAANLFLVKLNQIGALTLAPLASEKTYALQAPLVVRSEASLIDH
jgi:hypothetical protein